MFGFKCYVNLLKIRYIYDLNNLFIISYSK